MLKTNENLRIFPFYLDGKYGSSSDLFFAYVKDNREFLNATYGRNCYVGGKVGWEKSWSYYEVDIQVVDATTVVFHTYGMENFVSGGRGAKQEEIRASYPADQLEGFIATRKRSIARSEFIRRKKEREKLEEDAAIQKIMDEIFEPD